MWKLAAGAIFAGAHASRMGRNCSDLFQRRPLARGSREASPARPAAARRKNARPASVSAMCRAVPPLLCAM
jgi:hypothetical protein